MASNEPTPEQRANDFAFARHISRVTEANGRAAQALYELARNLGWTMPITPSPHDPDMSLGPFLNTDQVDIAATFVTAVFKKSNG